MLEMILYFVILIGLFWGALLATAVIMALVQLVFYRLLGINLYKIIMKKL